MTNHRMLLSYGLFITWILACGFAYWWFSLRYIQAYSHQAVEFNGEAIKKIILIPQAHSNKQGSTMAHVVHFIDEDCPCSRFSQAHIKKLEEKFGDSVLFSRWQTLPREIRESLTVPASPAVAVWDKNGKLNYFGPYSGGSYCGEGKDFVSVRLLKLQEGNTDSSWINHDVLGCYCPWKKST